MDERVTDEDAPALPAWRSAPPTVGAVLVTHDGGRWLPQVLASFSALEHAPTSWRVVDVSSTDDGPELVREAFGPDRVTYAPAGTGFGAAVRLAVDTMPRTDWLWLLHDDAIVEPGALAALLDEATAADDVAVAGPKIREWPSLRRLLEVGLTVTSTGVRETGLETGEPDAGQHDWPKDVLAVDTAGMLVRRDVWDELDGLSPDLPLYFDDIDLGWRVARAGYRTRIAPRAVIFHAEASRRGIRRRAAGDVEPAEQRRAALHTMLANTSGPRFWWQYVRLLVGSLLRTLGLVLSAHPESAGDQLQAVASVYGRPGRLRAARRRRAATARRDDRAVRHLFAPFWLPYRHGFDTARDVAAALVRPEAVETTGRRSTLDDDGDAVVTLDDGPPLWVRRPWLVTVGVLVVLSLVAGRSLLTGAGDSILTGGALGVTPGSAGDWWRLWFERSHEIGLGGTGLVSPAVLLLAVAATPIWPSPGLLVAVLLLLSVPLAALTAHRLGRRLTDHRRLRIVWAVGYGLT
ncbi:glycosyltransferase family 2 protein, partial [Aeromicrobium sp. REDSEA-S38_B2]